MVIDRVLDQKSVHQIKTKYLQSHMKYLQNTKRKV